MRTQLLSLLALSTLTSTREADACGSYVPEPRIYQLSSHYLAGPGVRSFVVLGGTSTKERAWTRLAPGTYDGTQIARGTTLDDKLTFTIVGKDGTKVVTGRKQVFLAKTFEFPEAATAVEVPWSGNRAIVIEGSHPSAKWIEPDEALANQVTYPTRALGVVELDGERRLVIGNGAWTSSVAI